MFGFKLWSRFGTFRDPLTITQNMTFPIPPKTTVGGMLAAILGIDYTDYFNDPDYFTFTYSLVLAKPVRKKSIAQNYVADYTKESEIKLNAMVNSIKTRGKYHDLLEKKESLRQKSGLTKTEEKFISTVDDKIEKAKITAEKSGIKRTRILAKRFRSPKPIFRELLMDPEYLVFIKDFKYEDRIIPCLKRHETAFSLYMGNSEFPANYRFLDSNWEKQVSDTLDSFTANGSDILFEERKKYTNVFLATRACGQREYRDYKNIVLCDKPIRLKKQKSSYYITNDAGRFYCEFV